MARVLAEWSSVSRTFDRSARPHLDELDLSRTLELAGAVLEDSDEPTLRSPRGTRAVSNRQRLAAVAVLATREAHLSAVQRLALVDAAAWWLTDPGGGEELAYALLAATCSAEVTTEHVYLALITPPGEIRRSFRERAHVAGFPIKLVRVYLVRVLGSTRIDISCGYRSYKRGTRWKCAVNRKTSAAPWTFAPPRTKGPHWTCLERIPLRDTL